MASKKKPKKSPPPKYEKPGQPTKYRPEYCQKLLDYMAQGNSFHLFGLELDPPVWSQTLFNWLDAHPEFLEAKRKGEEASERWWVNVLKAGSTGQLTRVKKLTPKMDNGQPVIGPDGKVVMEVEKEPATFNATATIFALKNKFPARWRDRKEIDVGGKAGAPVRISAMTKDEAKQAAQKMMAIFQEVLSDEEESEE